MTDPAKDVSISGRSGEASENDNDDYSVSEHAEMGKADRANQDAKVEAIVKRETRVVRGMRLVVLLVLVASSVLLAIFVHSYLKTTEENAFRDEFHSDADKVLDSMSSTLKQTLGSVDALSVSMVSYAKASNATWPFVTLPDFAVRSTKTRRLAKTIFMTVYMIVKGDEREEWEAYSKENNGWVEEGLDVQSRDKDYHGPLIRDYSTIDYIYDNYGDPMPPALVHFPNWQASP